MSLRCIVLLVMATDLGIEFIYQATFLLVLEHQLTVQGASHCHDASKADPLRFLPAHNHLLGLLLVSGGSCVCRAGLCWVDDHAIQLPSQYDHMHVMKVTSPLFFLYFSSHFTHLKHLLCYHVTPHVIPLSLLAMHFTFITHLRDLSVSQPTMPLPL